MTVRVSLRPGAAPIAEQLAARGLVLADDGDCQRLADALALLVEHRMLDLWPARACGDRIAAEVLRLARRQ